MASAPVRTWLEPERAVAVVTILIAATVEILAALHVLKFELQDHIIILLLGLLAVDSLTERMQVLEKLSRQLEGSPAASPLRRRAELPPVREQTEAASEMLILAVSGVALLEGHFQTFRRRLEMGCNVRIVLLEPNSSFVNTWNQTVEATHTRHEIESSLAVLHALKYTPNSKGKLKVRLSQYPPPYSLFAIDPHRRNGTMCIDFHTLGIRLTERPLVRLNKKHHEEWFELFESQFERAWEKAIDIDWSRNVVEHEGPTDG